MGQVSVDSNHTYSVLMHGGLGYTEGVALGDTFVLAYWVLTNYTPEGLPANPDILVTAAYPLDGSRDISDDLNEDAKGAIANAVWKTITRGDYDSESED